MPSYGGNAFINFRWGNTYIIAYYFTPIPKPFPPPFPFSITSLTVTHSPHIPPLFHPKIYTHSQKIRNFAR